MKIIPIEKNYTGISFGYYNNNTLYYYYKITGIKGDHYVLKNLNTLGYSSISIKGFNICLLNNSIRILQ